MYKIDRKGGVGVQKSYTWTDPSYECQLQLNLIINFSPFLLLFVSLSV